MINNLNNKNKLNKNNKISGIRAKALHLKLDDTTDERPYAPSNLSNPLNKSL